jgi:lysophospholipase L1-like esterase
MSKLATDWESFHPSINEGGGCGNTVRGKDCALFWLNGQDEENQSRSWDVITFNFGLHDLAIDAENVPLEEYKTNLRNISHSLLASKSHASPNLRLFWLSSTPVPNVPLSPPRKQADVPLYNAAAKEVMNDLMIPVIDVYAFVIQKCGGNESYTSCPNFQLPNQVHFDSEGSMQMAQFIYGEIMNHSTN